MGLEVVLVSTHLGEYLLPVAEEKGPAVVRKVEWAGCLRLYLEEIAMERLGME